MRLKAMFIAILLFAGSMLATAQTADPEQPLPADTADQPQPPTNAACDNQSLVQQLEAAEAQLASCSEVKNRSAKIDIDNRALRGQVERLRRQVAELIPLVPTPARDVTPLESFATDTTMTIAFKAYGGSAWVRAQAREVGGGSVGSPVLSEAMSTTPLVKLTGLDPDKSYLIDAVALRTPDGPEILGTSLRGEDWTQLQVASGRRENAPRIRLVRETRGETSHELTLDVSPRSLLTVECFQVIDPKNLADLGPEITCAKPPEREEAPLTGQIHSSSWEEGSILHRLTGLQPGTDYVVRISAINRYGQSAAQEFRRSFTTLKSNPFRLVQPLELTFTPAGLEVRATASKPLTSAQLEVAYPGRRYTSNDKLDAAELNGSATAVFKLSDLQGPKVVPEGEKEGKKVKVKQAPPPRLKLSLRSDSNDELEQEFIIGFIIPRNEEQLDQLQDRLGPLSKDQKEAINALLQTLAKPKSKSLTTEQWFQLGIPLLLAFL
jgi:hypothetical protein